MHAGDSDYKMNFVMMRILVDKNIIFIDIQLLY